jgi:hypothetical protein
LEVGLPERQETPGIEKADIDAKKKSNDIMLGTALELKASQQKI